MKNTSYSFLKLVVLVGFITFGAGCHQQTNNVSQGWDNADKIVKSIVIPVFRDKDYKVTDFGAKADGKTDAKPAFTKAIDACNFDGGGRVVVPSGTYFLNGPLHLKSDVNLYLSEGARLEFSTDTNAYLPMVLTKWEGTELFNYSPFIYAYQCNNIAITGKGVIDGNGSVTFAPWRLKQDADQQLIRKMGNDSVPVYKRVFGPGHYLRPCMIQPFGCKNVLIEGITIYDSPFWIIHPVFCTNVTVRNVAIYSENTNNDGFDPESTTNALLENCNFRTGDDGIAIKSGRDADGWRVGQPTENIVVRNCTFRSSLANGLCIGSEMSGGVRNVYIENCKIRNAVVGIIFKSNLDRGGYIEDIKIRNIVVDSSKNAFLYFRTNYHGYRGGNFPPRIQDISLENITCNYVEKMGISAIGMPASKLKNIRLKDITVNKAGTVKEIQYTEDFTMKNVKINGELLPEKPE
ncbi:MAG TPA: glycoside hydrolase family 28 protein [Bacteroidales bacterium]